ncbi:FecR family protein [Pedobacter africanus]|uniref:FecR family protein n=1 Tax=Pedobacter africanus TaxID=151894 RepID=A0A1W2A3T8_9SPHI|nr:FecR family protein [Pedobacter africanus]SMC55357.1 FecR family protein [Pedobacter africanus]
MKKDIKDILSKLNKEKLSAEEEAMAKYWLHQLNQQEGNEVSETQLSAASEEIWAGIQKNKTPLAGKFALWLKISGIAATLTAAVFGFYLMKKPGTSVRYANDISPGKNTAILTTADGKVINLNDAKTGIVVEAAKLVYNDGTKVQIGDSSMIGRENMNVSTPRGGQFQIVLSDGTRVWLNSASYLRFPRSFGHLTERRVELSGEGYFEVAKDKLHPFIVNVDGQEARVLGTHFNINSYQENKAIKTTLLEGSLMVTGKNNKVILKPGQQSVLTPGQLNVGSADLEAAVSWKKGYFYFNDEKITEVMSTISRWYDIDVNYEGEISREGFTGAISRFTNISDVLIMLEGTGAVRFKIEGRRVTVMN